MLKSAITYLSSEKNALWFAGVAQLGGRDGGSPPAPTGFFLRVSHTLKGVKGQVLLRNQTGNLLPQWLSSTSGPVKEGVCTSPQNIQFLLGFELLSAVL